MWSVEMLRAADLPADALAAAAPDRGDDAHRGDRRAVPRRRRPGPAAGFRPRRPRPRSSPQVSRVVELKSARYTVQRPAQLGAALGGGSPALHEALAAYGLPLGRAFQFRDDLLGVFGDPAVTGKPAGDDLREGKRTVLVAHAYAQTDAAGPGLLRRRLGDPALDADGVRELRQVINESGARQAVEQMIDEAYDEAIGALGEAGDVDGRTGRGTAAARAWLAAAAHRTCVASDRIDSRCSAFAPAAAAAPRRRRCSAPWPGRTSRPRRSRSPSVRAAASGSSASVMARTTQIRRAPASSTSSRVSALMPPIANQGLAAMSAGGATCAAYRTRSRPTGR